MVVSHHNHHHLSITSLRQGTIQLYFGLLLHTTPSGFTVNNARTTRQPYSATPAVVLGFTLPGSGLLDTTHRQASLAFRIEGVGPPGRLWDHRQQRHASLQRVTHHPRIGSLSQSRHSVTQSRWTRNIGRRGRYVRMMMMMM